MGKKIEHVMIQCLIVLIVLYGVVWKPRWLYWKREITYMLGEWLTFFILFWQSGGVCSYYTMHSKSLLL